MSIYLLSLSTSVGNINSRHYLDKYSRWVMNIIRAGCQFVTMYATPTVIFSNSLFLPHIKNFMQTLLQIYFS